MSNIYNSLDVTNCHGNELAFTASKLVPVDILVIFYISSCGLLDNC